MDTMLCNAETQALENNSPLAELNEMQLALVGGGSADVILA